MVSKRPSPVAQGGAVVCLALAFAVAAAAQTPTTSVGKYVGPGSCSASACHGSVRPMPTSRILQSEYSTWILQDRHAQAYKVLEAPLAQRMARILNIGNPATSQKCLDCHALAPPPAQRGREFDNSEGVSCENCHGPAGGWLGQHTLKGWKTAQSVPLGMVDTSNLIRRSEQCLTCHLGTADKQVDHEMIAAGHPDLVFELDSYMAVMPPHWKKPQDPAAPIRTMLVGQAVKLREALNRLSRRVQGNTWPEYAEMECFACHHDLTKADRSWRQERGYGPRRPGNAPWNAAHYSVLRVLLRDVDAGLQSALEKDFADVFAQASKLNPDRAALAQRATRAAATADKVAQRLNSAEFTPAQAQRMLQQLEDRADELAMQGTRSAEQAAMAIEALIAAQGRSSQPAVRSAVDELFRQLDNPSAYSGPRFAEKLRQTVNFIQSAAAGN